MLMVVCGVDAWIIITGDSEGFGPFGVVCFCRLNQGPQTQAWARPDGLRAKCALVATNLRHQSAAYGPKQKALQNSCHKEGCKVLSIKDFALYCIEYMDGLQV